MQRDNRMFLYYMIYFLLLQRKSISPISYSKCHTLRYNGRVFASHHSIEYRPLASPTRKTMPLSRTLAGGGGFSSQRIPDNMRAPCAWHQPMSGDKKGGAKSPRKSSIGEIRLEVTRGLSRREMSGAFCHPGRRARWLTCARLRTTTWKGSARATSPPGLVRSRAPCLCA